MKSRVTRPAEIQRACDEGWDNYQAMKHEGISPCLMTYHQFEHARQLTRIMNDTDYFASVLGRSAEGRASALMPEGCVRRVWVC